MKQQDEEVLEREVSDVDTATLALLNKSEIDQQIATAKRYPRSIRDFRDEAMEMVTLSTEVADECIYSLPRRERDPDSGEYTTKFIEGPSARFAEIILSAWGNTRAGARVVNEDDRFVTAQGMFYDLQRNVAIVYEVKRRITGKKGNRFSDDMIGVTSNAACSIALRNAICKGIPKAFWSGIYDAAVKTLEGDINTLTQQRENALGAFAKHRVSPEMVYQLLGVKGREDIKLEHLRYLKGALNALREGDTTVEQLFSAPSSEDRNLAGKSGLDSIKQRHQQGQERSQNPQPAPESQPETLTPSPSTAASTTDSFDPKTGADKILDHQRQQHGRRRGSGPDRQQSFTEPSPDDSRGGN